MKTNTLGLWMVLQTFVNPPDKITHDELMGASITLLTRDDRGNLTLNTFTLSGGAPDEKK